jgi:hypothetical protein
VGTLAAGNYSFGPFQGGDLTITKAPLTVTANDKTAQYSDPNPALDATITGFKNSETLATSGVTGSPSCTTIRTTSSAPSVYPITCTIGTLAAGNYSFPSGNFKPGSFTVTKEDARTNYTGALFASTASTTSSSATVTLSATIQDITAADPTSSPPSPSDDYSGDIRNASVTFVDRDAGNAVLCTASVGLVNLADKKTGTATCNWSASIGSSDSSTFTVGIVINNYYTRNSSYDDAVITVSKPLTTNFITGGGYLVMSSSSGQNPGATGSKMNYGFNVKYNKGGTNLQGNINIIVRNSGRVYQIKGNSMTSLSVTPALCANATTTSPCMAVFNGKANIRDITDPLNPISVDGNGTLQVTMTDKGEPGSADKIAVTLWNKSGGVWFASNWDGTKTVEQVLGGGNLVVH